jgi:hypothetical protein
LFVGQPSEFFDVKGPTSTQTPHPAAMKEDPMLPRTTSAIAYLMIQDEHAGAARARRIRGLRARGGPTTHRSWGHVASVAATILAATMLAVSIPAMASVPTSGLAPAPTPAPAPAVITQ